MRNLSDRLYAHILLCFFILLTGCSENERSSMEKPDATRFTKVELASSLDEPMELTVLPNGNVLMIERKGAIRLYDRSADTLRQVGFLPVWHGLEDGLLGLAKDPDYEKNHYIYLFYSPDEGKPMQRVSRFTFANETFDRTTEKVIIEIPTQRDECCHSAGSLAFGPNRTLYIALGDNTNPHNPGYYNSIDERKGREYWDAQRTAGNTNDLRGKILRIVPGDNGGYTVPDGNLFPKDGSKGKPEIFAMGCRNPYRISVDMKTGYLYWGDVGQNTEENPERGPGSYDEFHQAKQAGFFGWPYFAGDNQPYTDFDFATNTNGKFFDPLKPLNESPNNTGEKILPPAQKAMIWYSYDEDSTLFKNLGTGGKSPIGGPVYQRSSAQPDWSGSSPFPDYYNGKWFIAEWMRDWINVVTMNETGDLVSIDRFMPGVTFDHPIELEFGPDGSLYILEYGTFWFAANKNARLTKVEYHAGNRAPVAFIETDKRVGSLPLTVQFSAAKSRDYDTGDKLTYEWRINGEKKTGITIQHQFTKAGKQDVTLTVCDAAKGCSSAAVEILAGNEPPSLSVALSGNQSFYRKGTPIRYQVNVSDKEDGTIGKGISEDQVNITIEELPAGESFSSGAEPGQLLHAAAELLNKSDCKACHHAEAKSVGPSYTQISQRYTETDENVHLLSEKIIKGGNGNWGEAAMSAHPGIEKQQAEELVRYILKTYGDNPVVRMPTNGVYNPKGGNVVIRAAFTDKGAPNVPTLTARQQVLVRPSKFPAMMCDDYFEVSKFNNEVTKFTKSGAYIMFRQLDMTGVNALTLTVASYVDGILEIRIDSPEGKLIGSIPVTAAKAQELTDATKTNDLINQMKTSLTPSEGRHDFYIVFKEKSGAAEMWNSVDVSWVEMGF